jgi:protein-disulfide isomerase/uncharacterized membrane protein
MAKPRGGRKAQQSPRDYRWRLLSALALTAAGAGISAWLVWIHLALQADPDAGSACNLGGYFNCDIVNASRFASVLGIPIAYAALATYLTLGALALTEFTGGETRRLVVYSRVLGTLAVLYSAYLGVLSMAVLHALCVLCIALYVVNLGLAALGWLRPPPQLRVLETVRSDLILVFGGFRGWPVLVGAVLLIAGPIALRHFALREHSRASIPIVTVPIQSTLVSVAPGHAEGSADSPVVVVEFSDFECPHCKLASAALDPLRAEFAGQVRFVFKHFPLDRSCNRAVGHSTHPRACIAADAAVCAGLQDRLWDFQEEVFARSVDEEALQHAAEASGLNLAAWQQCRWTARARELVVADVEDGLRVGVNKTPTFLVGSTLLAGRSAQDELQAEIRRQLIQ